MVVKEILQIIPQKTTVNISACGTEVKNFDRSDWVMVEAFGDFKIHEITPEKENVIDIAIAFTDPQPIKEK